MKEYCNDDLIDLRRLLGCAPDIPVIVGHNPMWKWGDNDSIWINPAGTKDHVILYSNLPKKCPYLSFINSTKYKVKYADLKLVPRRFVLMIMPEGKIREDKEWIFRLYPFKGFSCRF
jgi:hypothetical protein